MSDNRIILDANLGRTNVIEFDDFSNITIETLEDISKSILPLCGADALHDLVIYQHLANEFMSNVFSNDGIHILKNTEYLSPIQTYIANYVRYIAERVERAAADGTSTAIFLAANLIASAMRDIQNIRRLPSSKTFELIDDTRNVMRATHSVADTVVQMIDTLLESIENLKIDVSTIDQELKEALIYQLAHTTSKQNDTLTKYAVELFSNLPAMLYEHTSYRRAQIETEEDLIIDRPEHDMWLSVLPFNNIIYNSKLGTELFHEVCDLLICPRLYGEVDNLLIYLEQRKLDPILSDTPLVIVFTGADDNELMKLETRVDREMVTVCRHTVYHQMFLNNPLELNVVQAVAGIDPILQHSPEEFEESVIEGVKIRLYNKDLYIHGLFDHTCLPLHPSYVSGDHPAYNKLRMELEERITSLKSSHNKKSLTEEINEFIRIYRSMICSKLPILTIGGSTINHLANINVVDDVLGVVSVAMKHGVIIDMMPKLEYALKIFKHVNFIQCIEAFNTSVIDFCRLTYRHDAICQRFGKLDVSLSECRDYMYDHGNWVTFDANTKDRVTVVQSYKAIHETLMRLKETIPRIICTDRIIVPNSVMGAKKE